MRTKAGVRSQGSGVTKYAISRVSVLTTRVLLVVIATAPARAADYPAALDCGADARLLTSHFGRYGYLPARSILPDGPGVRISLPAGAVGVKQTLEAIEEEQIWANLSPERREKLRRLVQQETPSPHEPRK